MELVSLGLQTLGCILVPFDIHGHLAIDANAVRISSLSSLSNSFLNLDRQEQWKHCTLIYQAMSSRRQLPVLAALRPGLLSDTASSLRTEETCSSATQSYGRGPEAAESLPT